MDNASILYMYEQLLANNVRKREFQSMFQCPAMECKKIIGVIWKHAITKILKWTPKEALKNLEPVIIRNLKLDVTFAGMDKNYKPHRDGYIEILQYAFPSSINYTFQQQTIDEYNRVAKMGEYRNDPSSVRGVKDFFKGSIGKKRAEIILRHLVRQYMGDMTLREKYRFFSDERVAHKWMVDKHLQPVLEIRMFETPLDYFFCSVPEDQDTMLYDIGRVYMAYNKTLRKMKKQQRAEKKAMREKAEQQVQQLEKKKQKKTGK